MADDVWVDGIDLEPGERLIAHGGVKFATGHFGMVDGLRFFRDFQRRDISESLPDWPPSDAPTEVPVKHTRQTAWRKAGRFTESALSLVMSLAVVSRDSNAIPANLDRANEYDDFPVLWADPGTVAYGAPWQLDPGRNTDKPQAVVWLTQRRVVFTDPVGEPLWEVSRSKLKATSLRRLNNLIPDVVLTFTDGSWIRLATTDYKDIELRGQLASLRPEVTPDQAE
ncbi:hypothetical protein ACIOC1_28400 [Streptomyces sp. NPDC088197]|uniref:hypothetical protein n=1 Tax=Streptomyces sp. NPDC088197 TaxID=3365840 RepID=UPI00382F8963